MSEKDLKSEVSEPPSMASILQRIQAARITVDRQGSEGAAPRLRDIIVNHRRMITERTWTTITPTKKSVNTINPVRRIFDGMNIKPNPEKPMISVVVGDPTIFGNLGPSPEMIECVVESARSPKNHGYNHSAGAMAAREAVAQFVSRPNCPVEAKNIMLSSGCSHALDMCMQTLGESGKNILCPRPGFSLYKTLSSTMNVDIRFYDLLPDRQWEIDIDSLCSQADENTVAIVVCNPSNPCGSVFSRRHMEEILEVASALHLPLIADEVYCDMVFQNIEYFTFAQLSKNVPILSCKALSKRFLVPGWRLGWIEVHDRNDLLKEVRDAIINLTQRLVGPSSIIQGAIPSILSTCTTSDFFKRPIHICQSNAKTAMEILGKCPGLFPIMPQGAMYMLVRIEIESFPGIKDDVKFTEALLAEQSVFSLPSACFEMSGYFRIVLTIPEDKLKEACERIVDFCSIHYKPVHI